jgi:hypothetical protein
MGVVDLVYMRYVMMLEYVVGNSICIVDLWEWP